MTEAVEKPGRRNHQRTNHPDGDRNTGGYFPVHHSTSLMNR